MRYERVELPPLQDNEVLIRVQAAGLNYIDVYHRTGLYPLPLPTTLGLEGAGVVEQAGSAVTNVSVGDRVGYCAAGIGAYATYRIAAAERLVRLPSEISAETAAALLLKGLTAEYLIRRIYPVRAGETVLFHAIAGGVGMIACQWLKQLGATVIGTVGSEEKAEQARALGCDHTILYQQEDVAARVREITCGAGVPVVFDSVGRATFQSSLQSLAPRGLFVSFGNASGAVEDFSPRLLAEHGSLFFTRPTLMHYCASAQELQTAAEALFFAVHSGLQVNINQRYALVDAAQAHRDLEARKTTGSTILTVDEADA